MHYKGGDKRKGKDLLTCGGGVYRDLPQAPAVRVLLDL